MRPTLIYDGQCRFCICQVQRARRLTGDAVEYLAAGASETARRFPEFPSARLERSLQFILPNGEVYEGAYGVLRLLGEAGRFRRLLWLYERSGACAALLEWGYRRVAGNRGWLGRVVPCSRRAGTRAWEQQ
jgi:predicted DCC family thiol-disulfide oxidoreductase YuxK